VTEAADQLEFRYAATADQFLTIAKLRAARQVWSRVLEASGVPAEQRGQLQHAVTSWTMTTVRDPWTTLLRDTLATFAAGVGGADAVTVLPFDVPLGLPGVLSRRMARNTSAILIEESHVARVTDPAGGSWYVESLTSDLAAAAWKVFQDTETAGGIVAGLKDGSVAARLASSAEAARERLAKRKDALTGVSEFPQLDEKSLERPAAPAQPGGGLPRRRRAEAHEALRDASDAFLASTGARPTVLAVTYGPLKAHSARLDYVRNLLAPGGIVTDVAAADALPETSPLVAVLVAADDVEPAGVQEAIAELRSRGATTVLRAGRSKLDWPGVDGFVYIGVDALAVLQQVQDQLGVNA
jgi:methylmalonyl-CoA mutase